MVHGLSWPTPAHLPMAWHPLVHCWKQKRGKNPKPAAACPPHAKQDRGREPALAPEPCTGMSSVPCSSFWATALAQGTAVALPLRPQPRPRSSPALSPLGCRGQSSLWQSASSEGGPCCHGGARVEWHRAQGPCYPPSLKTEGPLAGPGSGCPVPTALAGPFFISALSLHHPDHMASSTAPKDSHVCPDGVSPEGHCTGSRTKNI